VGSALAQNIVVLVNDEPITTFDIAQRQRWMVRTNGYGERMKAELSGDGIKQRFRQMMIAANPRSQAEAEQVAERVKKQLVEDAKRRVLSGGGDTTRKAAIESLIEDKLKLQAAKKQSIAISDAEVEETLAQRASGGNAANDVKAALAEFYAQFEADGISRKTIKDIIRAQLAWRDVIRKQYGPRIASLMASASSNEQKPEESELQFDVRILRLAVGNSQDQKAVSQRILEAENLREKFTSCKDLPREATLITQATVRTLDKAKLAAFPKDVQPLIVKASEGQMTPPVLVRGAVESYAICRKGLIAKAKPAEQKPDVRQQEYERFSRRYLQELKQSASIDYRGT
jgi:peptidyl-prolyl cis-trans isomerase SurA